MTEGTIELWGVPADHQVNTAIPRRAMLTLPFRCGLPPLSVTVSVRTWEQPDRWVTQSDDTGEMITGCDKLRFEPRLGFTLSDRRADVPSGARVALIVPQNEDLGGQATPLLTSVSIAMPAGLTVSPGGTAGITACADSRFGLGGDELPDCPVAARVGTIELDRGPGVEPATGNVFLGEERPGDRFRLLIATKVAGRAVKFTGSLQADPQTGRLTTTMKELPEAAFDRMTLQFDGGPQALLATPLACGPASTAATFSPNSGGPDVRWSGEVAIEAAGGGECAGRAPFAPGVVGGSTDARAGRPTAFTATVRRRDGEQLPRRLAIALPPGLAASLGTVDRCAEPQVRDGSCPPASRVGSAMAELGPGDSPARLRGDIFFTGPHRGASFGIALVLGGELGAFRLGTLVVRGALRVDPFSGRVAVEMDALPTIFEGVPIRFQTIGLDLDRPGFMRNPTSCSPERVTATLRSDGGAVATPSTPFRVRGCIDLPFRPDFSVALGGAGEMRERGRPALRMSMRMPGGGANLRAVEALLPRLLQLASAGPKALCPRRAARAGKCPAAARIGTAGGRTPLLKQPMTGFLYAVQPRGNGSPDLWASLSGQGLEISLRRQDRDRGRPHRDQVLRGPGLPAALACAAPGRRRGRAAAAESQALRSPARPDRDRRSERRPQDAARPHRGAGRLRARWVATAGTGAPVA